MQVNPLFHPDIFDRTSGICPMAGCYFQLCTYKSYLTVLKIISRAESNHYALLDTKKDLVDDNPDDANYSQSDEGENDRYGN